MSSSESDDESDNDVEQVNKRRKKRANLGAYPGTNPAGLKQPAVPKKKKRDREKQDTRNPPWAVPAEVQTAVAIRLRGHEPGCSSTRTSQWQPQVCKVADEDWQRCVGGNDSLDSKQ